MAKYGKKAQSKVKKVMHERKKGTLRSGKSGKKVTSRKQAIAIGLSEARRVGAKVPAKKSAKKSAAKKPAKKPATKKSAGRKSAAKNHRREGVTPDV
jgi:topoisomerase IA-like protein